jgi:hypothetical protein
MWHSGSHDTSSLPWFPSWQLRNFLLFYLLSTRDNIIVCIRRYKELLCLVHPTCHVVMCLPHPSSLQKPSKKYWKQERITSNQDTTAGGGNKSGPRTKWSRSTDGPQNLAANETLLWIYWWKWRVMPSWFRKDHLGQRCLIGRNNLDVTPLSTGNFCQYHPTGILSMIYIYVYMYMVYNRAWGYGVWLDE